MISNKKGIAGNEQTALFHEKTSYIADIAAALEEY